MGGFNLSAWGIRHPQLIAFLILAIGLAGAFAYSRLGRAEDPFFTVKVVNVSAIWPGATAAEMQTQVADPIEKKLQELPYFEKVQTYSKPSFTAMQVTFRDSTPPKDVPYLFYLLRKKLVDVQGQLPAGLLGPVVNDEFSDVDSILYMMTSDGADYAQLKKAAEGMRQRLLKVPGVTKVDIYGTQDEKIFVEFSHAKLATLGITFKHGKPYHPQTQGKIERYHQTLKKWLCANDEFDSIDALQRGVEFFAGYYNEIRPHQAHGRPPLAVYNERDKAAPSIEGQVVSPTTKVRRDRVDTNGTVTLRHRSKLHHIGVGRAHKNERVLMLVADLDVRVLDTEGTVLRHLTLDPARDYQPIR